MGTLLDHCHIIDKMKSIKALCLVSSLLASPISGWIQPKDIPVQPQGIVVSKAERRAKKKHVNPQFSAEVVGASGRFGSFLLHHGSNATSFTTTAVPRGDTPGRISSPGSPIFVATPSGAWPEIWDRTLPERRQDLVFVGNGIPPEYFKEATVVVPHFAVLQICRQDDTSNPVGTSPHSPKTLLFGKHASVIGGILTRFGVPVESVSSFSQLYTASAIKLVWATCLWLLCHAELGDGMALPITVGQVHEYRQEQLEALVDELLPSLESIVSEEVDSTALNAYLQSYSMSIAHAVPSLGLSIKELGERNGIFLSRRTDDHPQDYHLDLIRRATGAGAFEKILARQKSREEYAASTNATSVASL